MDTTQLSKLLRAERAAESTREQGAYLRTCNLLLQAQMLFVKGDRDLAMSCVVAMEQEIAHIPCPLQMLQAQIFANQLWTAYVLPGYTSDDEKESAQHG